jgi:4-carboxymuconolactone decarboxylase
MPGMGRIDRLPGLPRTAWSDDVARVFGVTVNRTAPLEADGGAPHRDDPLQILTVMAHQPRLLGPFIEWASALVLAAALPRRDHELLALRTAWRCRSDFEWGHHVVYARAAGLTDAEIARVVAGPDAAGWSAHDAALLRAADELHDAHDVTEPTWAALRAVFDDGQLVEVAFVVGQYTMLSMLANMAGVPLEDGYPALPAE